jgi:hypothetical protein
VSSMVTAELAPEFLERFWSFNDAVIRRIVLDLTRSAAGRRAVIDVMARDQRHNEDWVLCSIEIRGLVEFEMKEGPKGSYQVLSDGLKMAWQGDLAFLDFGTNSDTPDIEEIRTGGFYLAGNEVRWTVRQLNEADQL